MTFQELSQQEPRLKALFDQVKATHIGRGESVELIWYHEIKPKMKQLVGLLAQNEKLRTTEAYDLCYQILYDLLRSRKGRRREAKEF